MFLNIYRTVLSIIRPTYSSRRPSRAQSKSITCVLCTTLTSIQLLDRCLKIVDSELFDHLRSKNLSAELYAFPCEHLDTLPNE